MSKTKLFKPPMQNTQLQNSSKRKNVDHLTLFSKFELVIIDNVQELQLSIINIAKGRTHYGYILMFSGCHSVAFNTLSLTLICKNL